MQGIMDISNLSLKELKQLRKDVDAAIASFEDRQREKAYAELELIAREKGYSLSELANLAPKRKRPTSPARFAHPDDASMTWTGRGRRPGWFTALEAAGRAPVRLDA